MSVTFFTDINEFWFRTKDFLLAQEDKNNQFISNCLRAIQSRDTKINGGLMALVTESGSAAVKLAALLIPPYNLLLSAPGYVDFPGISEFIQAVKERGIFISGIQAETGLAHAFRDEYVKAAGCIAEKGHALVIYTLNKVNSVMLPSGCMRSAVQQDASFIPYWAMCYRRECDLIEKTLQMHYEETLQQIQDNSLYIWTNDSGVPLSMAAIGRKTVNSVIINQVYTPEYWRQKGYATAIVYCLSKAALDMGAKNCCLFADMDNPVSNSIYKKIGYEQVCDYYEIRFI